MSVDEYVRALERELRDQPREVRRAESESLREHLGELPDEARASLGRPVEYARSYRAERGLRMRTLRYRWRGLRAWVRVAIPVVVVLLAAVVGGSVWLARYQPVAVDIYEGGGVLPRIGRSCTEQNGVPDLICTVRTGDERFVAGDIVNHSRFTVDLLPPVNPSYGMFEIVRYAGVPCDRRRLDGPECPAVTRYPVHIAPGSRVYLAIVLRVAGRCLPAQGDGGNDTFGMAPITLRFHFAGGTRTVSVAADNLTAFQFDGCHGGYSSGPINPPSQ